MKKLVVLSILLVGCGSQSDGKPWAVEEICIKGVTYYASGYQLAPAFHPDGKLYTCNQ